MQFSSVLLMASAATAFFMAGPAAAIDRRILVSFKGESGTDFCNTWRCNCINYVPKDSSLSFQGAYCNPGDFSGKNPNSEAKVYCSFANSNGDVTTVNQHVASASGATIQK